MAESKRVLVTGAGRAIGFATVQVLAQRGHKVIATARDTSTLEGLDGIEVCQLDVTDQASVDACLAKAGDLDAVVNNAALGRTGPAEDYPLQGFRDMFETNALGALRMIQALLPSWRERGSGVIVNGQVGSPMEAAYGASKFALEAITEALHYEVRHFGVRSVIIQPGYIAPGMKPSGRHDGPPAYAELWAQWTGADGKMLGAGGRPGPEIVGVAIAEAIENPDTPLRVPVGDDAKMIMGARRALDDQAFEAAMRQVLNLTW